MPVAAVEPQPRKIGSAEPCAAPETRSWYLPIVQLGPEKPRVQVFYSAKDATEAAQASPEDAFFDVEGRGVVLMRSEDDGGSSSLEVRAEGDPEELLRRLLDEVRRFGLEAPAGRAAAEADGFLCWVEQAPSVECVVYALGLITPDYDTGPSVPDTDGKRVTSLSCIDCTKHQKRTLGTPPCC